MGLNDHIDMCLNRDDTVVDVENTNDPGNVDDMGRTAVQCDNVVRTQEEVDDSDEDMFSEHFGECKVVQKDGKDTGIENTGTVELNVNNNEDSSMSTPPLSCQPCSSSPREQGKPSHSEKSATGGGGFFK